MFTVVCKFLLHCLSLIKYNYLPSVHGGTSRYVKVRQFHTHPHTHTQTAEPQAKISDLTAGVLTTVNNECGDDCMLLSSQITNAQLDCTTSNVAVYRATLDVTNGENCTQLIAILQDWISTSPSLVVQSVRIRIASYCEVEFESVDIQSDCMNPSDNGTRPTTGTQATEQTPSGESEGVQLSMIEIIAVSAVGGGVALLLILTLLIICCVFIVRISRISKTR